MPGPLLYLGASAGLNLASRLFGTGSARRAIEERRRRALEALRPYEGALQAYRFGPSQAEGALLGEAVGRATADLANRGMGRSSLSGPATVAAMAPILAGREQNILDRLQNLAAAKRSIYADEMPGYGGAFAGALGDIGGMLAYQGGRSLEEQRLEELLRRYPQLASTLGFTAGARGVGTMSGAEPKGSYWGPE